ncbi:MAG: hypothetical protein M3R47_12400 [Chloroflexota bacterium]|nr:hypothetical protein [Chloroflexota bacterium]
MQLRAILILVTSILLTSCRSGFSDMSQTLSVREMIKIPTGKYAGIAWVSKTTLVVEVDEGNLFENQKMCSKQIINIYEFRTNLLQPLLLPFEGDCRSYIIRDLQVLPNQQAGYVFEDPMLNSLIIKTVNVTTATEVDLYAELPGNSSLDRFSYSPSMKELLLVDVQSPLLKSAIYLLDANRALTNITADFLRADFPIWSRTSNFIAFLGTKPYPGNDDKIEHFSQLEGRVDYPWRIYLYDPQELTTKELPFDIVHPSSLKWSPDGNMLAFSGEYKGVPGIWIIDNFDDSSKSTITRIVNGLATFDFSPEGRSIAFAYIGLQNNDRQNILYTVDLPD